jgi:hypothetical protein
MPLFYCIENMDFVNQHRNKNRVIILLIQNTAHM